MKEKLILTAIVIFALLLRVIKVDSFPAGLNADEAAIGYNAYSLLQTGKDEFGHSWPINFQSFNDYKPGLYFYLVLPFVKLFGLNEIAVRFPSVILGTMTVLLLYLLIFKLFKAKNFALLGSFLLAISPWHLHFSRGGWESNAAVFFIVLGVYLFFTALDKPKNFLLCALSFVLSMYTYHSARIIAPLLIMGLAVFYWQEIFKKKNTKFLVITFMVAGALMIPLAVSFLGGAGTSRFSGVGIFADQGPFWRVNQLRGQHQNPFGFLPRLLHNQYTEYFLLFFYNLLSHYSGNFLFLFGDEIQRNKVPGMGQMHLIESAFFFLGLYFLIKKRPDSWKLWFYWLAVSPFASALTFQSPHAIRALNQVIPLVVITAYGLQNSVKFFFVPRKRVKIKTSWGYLALALLYSGSIFYYLNQYYVFYPRIYPSAWEYGFKELVGYVKTRENEFEKIYVTKKYDQPYILFAFYLRYPPELFQNEAKLSERDEFGFSTVERFDNFVFGPINNEIIKSSKSMIIGTPEEIPDSATIVKRIYFKDGKTEAFRIIEN